MSMHTPGPWHWDSDPIKDDPLGRVRYRVTATGKTITQVYYSGIDGARSNAEYDSQLIAAAPELLNALERIVNTAKSMPEWCDPVTLEIAKDAIRKAHPEAIAVRG